MNRPYLNQPHRGFKLSLQFFAPKHATVVQAWYYDHRYSAFFRDFDDLMLSNQDFTSFDKLFGEHQGLFVIELGQSNQAIGLMTYTCVRQRSGVYKFGILLDQNQQHKTYAIEAITILLDYLFRVKGGHKIVVEILTQDKHIQRITEQGGFTFETVLKQEARLGDEYLDEARYCMMKDKFYELYGEIIAQYRQIP